MAERPIVLSARFYFPPGDRRISHFHLWRIRPDGTGLRQLTEGTADDQDPRWSPDGKRILFWRIPSKSANGSPISPEDSVTQTCVMGADGGKAVRLPAPEPRMIIVEAVWWDATTVLVSLNSVGTGAGGDFRLYLLDARTGRSLRRLSTDARWSGLIPSPDKTQAIVGSTAMHDDPKQPLSVADLRTGTVRPLSDIPLSEEERSCFWRDNETIVVWKNPNQALILRAKDGTVLRTLTVKIPASYDPAVPIFIGAWPGKSDWALLSAQISPKWNAAWHARLDLASGKVEEMELGYHPAFSPDGSRFVAPGDREPTDYGTKPGGPPHAVMTVKLMGGTVGVKPKCWSRDWWM